MMKEGRATHACAAYNYKVMSRGRKKGEKYSGLGTFLGEKFSPGDEKGQKGEIP